MKRYLLLLSFSFLAFFGISQVSGIVNDPEGLPVEFASVRLFSALDSTVAQGIYTDDKGGFILENVAPGDYYMIITYTNYENHTIDAIKVEKGRSVELGSISMSLDKTLELEGVVATGSLDVLKAGIDKKIYDIKDDISVKGGTVNDVLQNIPSIDVDQDGNISLRGDGNVTILIDGRPSGLVLGDGQNLLDGLPANSIERIEVVTNPSAKYDPDGTSGIINIVMKKNKLKGFNGIVSATAATGDQYEANFAIAYRNKRVNTYLNYSFNSFAGFRNFTSELHRDFSADSTTSLYQNREGTDLKRGNTLVIGSDFFINDRNVIGLSMTGSTGYRKRTGDLQNLLSESAGNTIIDRWERLSEDPRKQQNADVNLNYVHKLKEELGEWSFNANHSIGVRDIQGYYTQNSLDDLGMPLASAPLVQRLDNQQTNNVTTVQTDFNYVLKKINARVETGAKAIVSSEDVNTFSETQDTLTGEYAEDTLANFDYRYEGGTYSLYGIFGQEVGKFKYQVGVRAEYAEQDPQLLSEGEQSYLSTFFNLFPSAHLKYDLGKNTELSVSYSRRINRPRSRQLNPFTSYADPFNLRSGNPFLQPEFIHSMDLGISYSKKKVILTASVFHRQTTDVINRVKLYRDDNTSIVTYDNIDKSVSTGMEFVMILKPFKWWKNTFSFNGNYIDYTNNDPLTDWNNDGFNWGAKYIGSVDFWKKTANFQVNASYNAPRITPQGKVLPRAGVNISAEKRLLQNKQLSIGARVTDVFNTRGFEIDLEQEGIRQVSEFKWLTRRFFITASYKFGKYEKIKKPRSTDSGGGDF